jgi:hypothetical protein
MSIEMHSFTVTLAAADPSACASRVEHRARVWQAVSDFSRALTAAGMAREARVRGQDSLGHVLIEATSTGAAFLSGLPGVVAVAGRA